MTNEFALAFKDRDGSLAELKEELATKIGKAQAVVLLGKTPKSEIRKRLMNPRNPKGPNNPEFSYLEHAYVEQVLNFAFGMNWDAVVEKEEWMGDDISLTGYIEVRFKNFTVKKTGFGGAKFLANNPNMSRADAKKSAYSDMIKNAATKLGIGLDLYRHEEVAIEKIEKAVQVASGEPDGKQMGGPATEAQLQAIKSMGGTLPEDSEEVKKITFGQAVEWIKKLREQRKAAK